MQQVADWLQKLGIGPYAQSFAENDIDFSVLPYLTDTDLEKIGVWFGHRRKIRAAIAELPGAASSKHIGQQWKLVKIDADELADLPD
jgi:hypothetical protein